MSYLVRCLPLRSQSRGQAKRKRKVESSEKDKPCVTKMVAPPAC